MGNKNQNASKKAKKSKLKLDKELLEKIPYTRVFEEEGIIETTPGVFTKCYFINKMNFNIIKDMDSEELFYKISSFLNSIDNSLDFQFILHNKVINQDSFRDNVMLRKRPDGLYEDYLRNYNEILVNKLSLGNNNVKKDKYFIISFKADIVEEAINKFRIIDTDLRNKFNKVCGIEIVALSIVERLRVLYNFYNLGLEKFFGSKVNFTGEAQSFSFKNMKHLKLTTKDVVGPMSIEEQRDYLKINDKYIRTFFLNNVPSYISENFISDTSNVSPNMIVSIHYNSLDHAQGLEIVNELIAKNTIEQDQKKSKRKATLKNNELALSKRNAPKSSILVAKELNEDTYFNEEAKKVLTEANSINHKIFNTSVIITLYADDLDTLDIDTEVLMMSANKFLCQFKSLDHQQLKGFNACLPLALNNLSVERVFNCDKASILVPLNIQEILKRDGLYYGVNRITDNVILLNRNNSKNKNGFIMGQKKKGKTFAAKREILNTIISTNDHVIVISNNDSYDNLANRFEGEVISNPKLNPFKTHVRYSDQDDASVFKKTFLYALFTSLKNYVYGLTFEEQEEINALINYLKSHNYDETVFSIQDYLNKNNEVSKVLCKYLYSINENMKDKADTLSDKRLAVYKSYENEYDNLILLDNVWNKVIENAGKGIQTWVYIENIDMFFKKPEISNYLKEMYSRSVCWPVIITGIVTDNETFTKNPVANVTIQDSGYVKLLSQGPVERQVLANLLNLSNSILPYISNVNAGQGLIVTPAANMTFDDVIDNKFLLSVLN